MSELDLTFGAMYLPEIRRARDSAPPPPASPEGLAAAEMLVHEWQQTANLDDARFAARLAAEGLDRRALVDLVATRESARPSAPAPEWQEVLERALQRMRDGAGGAAPPVDERRGALSLAAALDGFVAAGLERVRTRAVQPAHFEIDWAAVAPGLCRQLRALLAEVCEATLVLELNVARLEGRLAGETPEARFEHFVTELSRDPGAWARLFDEYRGMARSLGTAIAHWADSLLELLGRLAQDFPLLSGAANEIANRLLPSFSAPRLVALIGGISDPHCGGRGVYKLEFTGAPGERGARLVYKPRPLAVDAHFQELLRFCNDRAREGELRLDPRGRTGMQPESQAFPELRLLRILDRGEYGWIEHVERRDCEDAAAVARFYVRQGAYLALLHAFDGVDIHHENLIAAGEQPVLVDLETLFHPWLPFEPTTGEDAAASDAGSLARDLLRDSVARTALLPSRTGGDHEHAGINLGGLGTGEAQMTAHAVLDWARAGSDEMHAIERPHEIPPGDNLPRLGGAVIPVIAHADDLVSGFDAMWRFLVRHREELLGPRGLIRAFADDDVRRVLRGTMMYGRLLRASFHPDHGRDVLEREALFDVLWAGSAGQTRLTRVIPSEQADLREGDVPYFRARPSSCDLWDSRGTKLSGLYAASALDQTAARLASDEDREIRRQELVIRGTVSAAGYGTRAADPPSEPVLKGIQTPLDAAIHIGEELSEWALVGERDATWLGMHAFGDGKAFGLLPLGGSLYEGTAGLALFLGHLGHAAGRQDFTDLAERAARHVRATIDKPQDKLVGGFLGLPSQLYALANLAVLWNDRSLLMPLGSVLDGLAGRISADTKCDVLYGAAGGLLAMLALHDATGDEQALDVAVALGRHLLAKTRYEGGEASWPCSVTGRHLLGFSHGTAGVANALVRLAKALAARGGPDDGASEFLSAAQAALAFERRRFDAQTGQWPDLRFAGAGDASEKRPVMVAWCHGAPGIALSRLAMLFDAEARQEVEAAIETTLRSAELFEQTLCHGELGNLLIVHRAAALLKRDDWKKRLDARVGGTLARLRAAGPECGFRHRASAPALMTGLAGIGYGMLHLACPDTVPFVLDLSSGQAAS